MRRLPLLAAASLALASSAHAIVLLSTGFTTVTNDTVPYSGPDDTTASKTVGFLPAWTVGDSAVLGLVQVTSVSFTHAAGTSVWGTSADPINAGKMWTTLGDGRYLDGNNATYRFATTSPLVQFNAAAIGGSALSAEPDGVGVFNFVIDVKQTIEALSLSVRAGTAQTSGSFDNNTAAGNGNINVRVVSAANTASGFSFLASPMAIGAGAGPTVTLNAEPTQQLVAGQYVVQIQLSGKTTNQRYSIDDLAFSGTAIPEPSTYAVLAAGAVLGVLALRRRRRA